MFKYCNLAVGLINVTILDYVVVVVNIVTVSGLHMIEMSLYAITL